MRFRFVDQILAWTPYQRIQGLKTVSFEEYCLPEPFGDEPHLPETLLLESFMQLGNWLILLSSDFQKMGMVSRITKVMYHDRLRPGQTLSMDIHITHYHEHGFELSGAASVGDRVIAEGLGCLGVPVPATDLVNVEDLRVLFGEIYRPHRRQIGVPP